MSLQDRKRARIVEQIRREFMTGEDQALVPSPELLDVMANQELSLHGGEGAPFFTPIHAVGGTVNDLDSFRDNLVGILFDLGLLYEEFNNELTHRLVFIFLIDLRMRAAVACSSSP